jgi:hypothetical protein
VITSNITFRLPFGFLMLTSRFVRFTNKEPTEFYGALFKHNMAAGTFPCESVSLQCKHVLVKISPFILFSIFENHSLERYFLLATMRHPCTQKVDNNLSTSRGLSVGIVRFRTRSHAVLNRKLTVMAFYSWSICIFVSGFLSSISGKCSWYCIIWMYNGKSLLCVLL